MIPRIPTMSLRRYGMDGADSLIMVCSVVMRKAMPVHRAHKEAHREKLSEVAIPFSLSARPGSWAMQNLHACLLP